MIAAESSFDWTPVLVASIPILLVQVTTMIIAGMNHRKASDAATKAEEAATLGAEVHRRTTMSNGHTLGEIIEAVQQELGEVRANQAGLARQMGAHLADHERRHRDGP